MADAEYNTTSASAKEGNAFTLRREMVICLAKSFETIREFRCEHPNEYGYAHKRGFATDAFAHMRRIRVTQDNYTEGRHCTRCLTHQPIDQFLKVGRNEKRRRSVCITCHNEESRLWREANSERAREIVSMSAKRNPETGREMKRRARQKAPEAFAARDMLKRLVRATGRRKSSKTSDALGYTTADLRAHIEGQFREGMSWENWGDWHIDHIKPVCVFVNEGVTDPSVINALNNLRPLWASENIARARARWTVDECHSDLPAQTGADIF